MDLHHDYDYDYDYDCCVNLTVCSTPMDDDGENQFHFSDEEEEDHHQDELNKKKKKKKKKKIPIINKRTAAMMVDRDSSSSSSSMENINSSLLRLKFKIPSINNTPSTECSGDEGAALLFPHQTSSPQGLPDTAQQQEIRVCRICKKGFPSGRALGGHMRIHNNNTTHADDDEDEFPKKLPNPNKQLKKQLKASALLSLSNNAASLAAAGEEEPTTINCAICNKTFRSNKSLFGHMRCHPNREWRGILPPPPPTVSTKNSPSSTVSNSLGCHKMEDQIDSAAATPALVIGSSSQSVDPVRALPRWSVKERRGRAANTNANQEIPEAAYDLMMLSRGESLDSGLSNFKQRSYDELDNIKKRSSEESETGNFNSRDLIIRKPEMGSGSGRKRKRSYLDGSEGEQEEDGDYNDAEKPLSETEFYDGSLVLAKMKKKKKKKKKLNLRDLERVDNMSGVTVVNEYKQSQSQHLHKFSADKYKCTTCSKSFPSHQALGGHRSSHYKIKISPSLHPQDEFAFGTALALAQSQAQAPTPAEEEEEEEVEEHYEVVPFPNTTNLAQLNDPTEYVILGSNSRLVNGTANTYMCEICNRTFPTGQALGGHKRCHWTPVEVHPSSVALQFYEEAPPAPASKSASDSGTGQRMLAFDLNELPTTTAEDGDEEDQGGMKQIAIVDYTSSSENSAN